jgi:hypothetical protein
MDEYGLDEADIIILQASTLAIERYLLPLWKIRERRKLAKRINTLIRPIENGTVKRVKQ